MESPVCKGNLCPKSFDIINIPGFVSRVVLLPYLYRAGEIKIIGDDGFSFLSFECDEKESPFSCAESKWELKSIPIKRENVTHIIVTGYEKPASLYIFVKVSSKDKNLYLLDEKWIYTRRMQVADAYHDIKKILEELREGASLRRVQLIKGIYEGLRYKKVDFKQIEDLVKFEDKIGKGSYGEVYKGILLQDIVAPNGIIIKTETVVAIKKQPLNVSKLIEHELYALYKVMERECPNLLQIYDVLYDFNRQMYYIITEYIEGKDLRKLVMTKNKEFQAHLENEDLFMDGVLQPLINAVKCLHEHNIAHRDIKGGNILYDEKNKRIVLIDLGLSCFIPKCRGRGGTPATMYPMYFDQNTSYENIDKIKADWWSVGTTIYQLFTNYRVYPLNKLLSSLGTNKRMINDALESWKGKIEYGKIPKDFKRVSEIFKSFTIFNE
jgi:hypothetical protein